MGCFAIWFAIQKGEKIDSLMPKKEVVKEQVKQA